MTLIAHGIRTFRNLWHSKLTDYNEAQLPICDDHIKKSQVMIETCSKLMHWRTEPYWVNILTETFVEHKDDHVIPFIQTITGWLGSFMPGPGSMVYMHVNNMGNEIAVMIETSMRTVSVYIPVFACIMIIGFALLLLICLKGLFWSDKHQHAPYTHPPQYIQHQQQHYITGSSSASASSSQPSIYLLQSTEYQNSTDKLINIQNDYPLGLHQPKFQTFV